MAVIQQFPQTGVVQRGGPLPGVALEYLEMGKVTEEQHF